MFRFSVSCWNLNTCNWDTWVPKQCPGQSKLYAGDNPWKQLSRRWAMPLGTALKIRNEQPHIWQVLVCAYAVRRVINVSFLTVSSCYPVITHTFFSLQTSLLLRRTEKTIHPFLSPERNFSIKEIKLWTTNLGREKPVALRTCFCTSPTQCARCSRMVHLSSSMCYAWPCPLPGLRMRW